MELALPLSFSLYLHILYNIVLYIYIYLRTCVYSFGVFCLKNMPDICTVMQQ